MDLHKYGRLTFGKSVKAIQGRKDGLFTRWCWNNFSFTCQRNSTSTLHLTQKLIQPDHKSKCKMLNCKTFRRKHRTTESPCHVLFVRGKYFRSHTIAAMAKLTWNCISQQACFVHSRKNIKGEKTGFPSDVLHPTGVSLASLLVRKRGFLLELILCTLALQFLDSGCSRVWAGRYDWKNSGN